MHKDTVGDVEWFSPTRLMLMGAGAEFQHEELVDRKGEHLRALQIFLRPRSAGLEPQVQFHDFGNPISVGEWRLIAGPAANDPLRVRSETWVEDGRFEEGTTRTIWIWRHRVAPSRPRQESAGSTGRYTGKSPFKK